MLPKFPQERATTRPARDCATCCFSHSVETKGKQRRICMLLGEKNPQPGQNGCHYLAGAWADIDAILLAKSRLFGDTENPNHTELVTAFSKNGINVTDIHSLDDSIGKPINHTQAEKLEGSLVRLGIREGQVARMARERA